MMEETEGLRVAGLTHQGMVRKDNQDSYGFIEPEDKQVLKQRGRLFVVADGLGGHRGGSVASKMAVEIIGKVYYSSKKEPIYPALLDALEVANKSIFESGGKHEELQGMATTCTTLVVKTPYLYMAHVGDSRAYLIRGGRISQLSTDHTLVEEMVHSGIINHDEARTHPDSHILTRSLGILQSVEVEILDPPLRLENGDKLLMCSDGLTVYLEDEEILDIVKSNSLEKACEILIETANERGGRDNITVEIISIECVGSSENKEAVGKVEGIVRTGKLLGDTQPVISKFSAPSASGTKNEIAWAALFYIVYSLCMLFYFLHYFH